jgi:cob(I)alamin adenosyltransferase
MSNARYEMLCQLIEILRVAERVADAIDDNRVWDGEAGNVLLECGDEIAATLDRARAIARRAR